MGAKQSGRKLSTPVSCITNSESGAPPSPWSMPGSLPQWPLCGMDPYGQQEVSPLNQGSVLCGTAQRSLLIKVYYTYKNIKRRTKSRIWEKSLRECSSITSTGFPKLQLQNCWCNTWMESGWYWLIVFKLGGLLYLRIVLFTLIRPNLNR